MPYRIVECRALEEGEGAADGFDFDGEDADRPALGGTAGGRPAHAAAARGANPPAGWWQRRQAAVRGGTARARAICTRDRPDGRAILWSE